MDKKIYIIGEVLDNDTNERSKDYNYRIGRKCSIIHLEEGENMLLGYVDGRVMKSSVVSEIDQTDYGFWVTTCNRTYRLDLPCFYN